MTPLHLEMLLHYKVSAVDYEGVGVYPSQTEFAEEMMIKGLLYLTNNDEQKYGITKYGVKIADKILRMAEQIYEDNDEI